MTWSHGVYTSSYEEVTIEMYQKVTQSMKEQHGNCLEDAVSHTMNLEINSLTDTIVPPMPVSEYVKSTMASKIKLVSLEPNLSLHPAAPPPTS